MNTTLTSRRRFLWTVAGVGAAGALGLWGYRRSLAPRTAVAQGPKLKVVFFITPDGLAVDSFTGGGEGDYSGLWHPVATGTDTTEFTLGEVSNELAAYRGQSLYLRKVRVHGRHGGHNAWPVVLRDNAKSMTSIDNLLGEVLRGRDPALKAVFAGPATKAGAGGNPYYVSFIDNSMRVPEPDPVVLFESIFGASLVRKAGDGLGGKHLFDLVLADLNELRGRLSGHEQEKLNTHLDSVEQVVAGMEGELPPVPGCNPEKPDTHPIHSPDSRTQIQRSHNQVVATALSCGLTRVATIQLAYSVESMAILDVPGVDNPHECAHRTRGEGPWKGSRKWYVQQVKHFLDELAARDDPDVPGDKLLQHTLVVLTSEMSDGAPEHMMQMPIVLIGGASGLLRSGDGKGRYYDIGEYGDTPEGYLPKEVHMQRIWATIAQAAGTSVPYGGNVDIVPGIFSNVT